MSLLRLAAVRREIGSLVILDSVSAAIADGEHIGLVGANGAGKTSLLRVIAGIDEPDAGQVLRKRSLRTEMLVQEANLDAAFVDGAKPALGGPQRRPPDRGVGGPTGVSWRRPAPRLFSRPNMPTCVTSLRCAAATTSMSVWKPRCPASASSWPNGSARRCSCRAASRRALHSPAYWSATLDLLMLDEPTNHLDVAAIEWLETTLADRPGALLVASHDRAFLDGVASRIWELRDRRLEIFRGNYSAYLAQREERDARTRKEAATRQGQIERERNSCGRYRSHRKFSKMHEHERRLDALRDSATASVPGSRARAIALNGRHALVGRSGDVAVSLEELIVGYPGGTDRRGGPTRSAPRRPDRPGRAERQRQDDAAAHHCRRARAARGLPRAWASGVQIGYLAQIRAAPLPGMTVLETLVNGSGLDAGPARSYLARFLFTRR